MKNKIKEEIYSYTEEEILSIINANYEQGKLQALSEVEKILDSFWLESDGVLGYSYLKELKSKIKEIKNEKQD